MSTRRLATTASPSHELSLATTRLRRNGLEFHSARAVAPWTEMTVTLPDARGGALEVSGIVVDCRGDRARGFQVALLFHGLTPHTEARLSALASRASSNLA